MESNTFLKVAEVELTYKLNFKASERPKINTSKQAYEVLIAHWSLDRIELVEEFKILLLNRRNRILGLVNISSGGVSGTIADPKIIFSAGLKACASGIILCHSHPSGELDPSREDIALTNKLSNGGALLDLKILDHLIISKDSFYSFADEGMM